jgi:hypothetical protein
MARHVRIITAAVVFALAAGAGIALADEHSEQTVIRSRDFTIAKGQCPQLRPDLEIKGVGLERTTTVVESASDGEERGHNDGAERLSYSLSIKISGTATDNLGGNYTFRYQLRLARPVVLPGTGIVTDTFRLSGTGAADGMATFFRVKVTFDAGANPIAFELLDQSGNPFQGCDPL